MNHEQMGYDQSHSHIMPLSAAEEEIYRELDSYQRVYYLRAGSSHLGEFSRKFMHDFEHDRHGAHVLFLGGRAGAGKDYFDKKYRSLFNLVKPRLEAAGQEVELIRLHWDTVEDELSSAIAETREIQDKKGPHQYADSLVGLIQEIIGETPINSREFRSYSQKLLKFEPVPGKPYREEFLHATAQLIDHRLNVETRAADDCKTLIIVNKPEGTAMPIEDPQADGGFIKTWIATRDYGAQIGEQISQDVPTGRVGSIPGPRLTFYVLARDLILEAQRKGDPIEPIAEAFGIPSIRQDGGSLQQVQFAQEKSGNVTKLPLNLHFPEEVLMMQNARQLRQRIKNEMPLLSVNDLNNRTMNLLRVYIPGGEAKMALEDSWKMGMLMRSYQPDFDPLGEIWSTGVSLATAELLRLAHERYKPRYSCIFMNNPEISPEIEARAREYLRKL